MITCELAGGLGNQMFMIFNTISCAREKGQDFWFKYSTSFPNSTTRYPYWDTLFSNLKPYVKDQDYEPNTVIVNENHVSNLPLILNPVMLQGYFQKPIYFEKYYKEIYQLIDFDTKKNEVLEKIGGIGDVVSLHFRLGDYKKYQHCHPILSYEYYRNSVLTMKKECDTFMYFYEDEDEEYVKDTIRKLEEECKVTFVSSKYGLTDWEEMLLMSLCKHHIIANSTFSWWGAYLNPNPKKVIYPEKWYGDGIEMNVSFPSEWEKLQNGSPFFKI